MLWILTHFNLNVHWQQFTTCCILIRIRETEYSCSKPHYGDTNFMSYQPNAYHQTPNTWKAGSIFEKGFSSPAWHMLQYKIVKEKKIPCHNKFPPIPFNLKLSPFSSTFRFPLSPQLSGNGGEKEGSHFSAKDFKSFRKARYLLCS